MKRMVSVFLSLVGAAAFGDITGPGVYELNPGDDINAKIEWLDAQPGASDYLQTIVLNPGTYTIDNEVMMTNKVVICGKTGNPADVIVDVQGKNKAFCLNNVDAVLHSLTVMNGLCTGTGSYGVIRVVKPNGRGNVTNSTKGKGVGGLVSNIVCVACQTKTKRAAGVIYVDADTGVATHCVVKGCTGDRQMDDGRNHGIFLYVEAGTARNCLVAGNSCSVSKTATESVTHFATVAVNSGSLVNCTVVDNEMTGQGAKIACGGVLASGGRVVNALVFGNSSASTEEHYSQWAGTADCFLNCALDAAEKLNESCLSVTDPGFLDAANGDYRILGDSPCCKVGTLEATYEYGMTDLAGNPRVRTTGGVSTIDIGAYQSDVSATILTATCELPELLYDRATIKVTAEASGFGDVPVFYYDFNSDGVADLITTDAEVMHDCGVGAYHITVTASNLVDSVGQSFVFENGFEVVPHPVHYVDVNCVRPVSPFLTPATAAKDIQSALDVAGRGEEVVILPGLYEVSVSLYVTNDFLNVHGSTGKPEDVIVRAVTASNRCMQVNAGAHTIVHSLVLENGRCGSGIRQPVSTFGYGPCLNIANIEQVDSRDRGYETIAASGHLGGTVSNCVIRGGSFSGKYSRAGGAFLYGANAFITHCVISNNLHAASAADKGWFGGNGLYLCMGAKAAHCLVSDNYCVANSFYRAAVVVAEDSVMRYSTITGNRSTMVGGVNVAANGRFEKCVIAGNTLMPSADTANPRHVVWGAFDFSSDATSGRFDRTANLQIDLDNEIIRAASDEVRLAQKLNASDCETAAMGEGSVCAPIAKLFSKPAQGDYSPRAGSPSAKVVPVGSETDMPAVDLLGKPRASGGAYDLGAYQHQASGLMILFK